MKHDKATMNRQRKALAIIGFLLPFLSTLPGFWAYKENGPEFWYSISATFYATSSICMIAGLSIFAFYLWNYQGYDIGDKFTCRFSALMCIGILVFPCACAAAGKTTGIFNIPTNISNVIHCVVAGLLFGSFAYMIGFRFTKSTEAMTREKLVRNMVYRSCCKIIMVGMLAQIITSYLGVRWMTIINETVMLGAFSYAWAVKADMIKTFIDKRIN